MRGMGKRAFNGRVGALAGPVRAGGLQRWLTKLACAALLVGGAGGLTGLSAGLLPTVGATGTTCTWTGGGGSTNTWSDSSNWSCGGVTPAALAPADVVTFSTSFSVMSVDDISGLSISELEFQAPNFRISAATGVTLTLAPASGGNGISDSGSGGVSQIGVPLVLSTAQTFQIVTDTVTITAPLTGTANLTIDGSPNGGTVELNAASPNYSGATTVLAGNLFVGNATALGTSTVPVTVASATFLQITPPT